MTLNLIGGSGGGFGGGKGGGGGGQRVPAEDADSLQSTQYASILDLLSEGEIEGLDNGLQSVYLDGTPIVAPDGSNNFTGYTTEFRTGTQAQAYIPVDGIESETGVNVAVTTSSSVVRTIVDSDVSRVRVTVQLPSLQIITDSGDIIGHSVRIQLQIQYNGGGYTTVVDDTISGKTTNNYQRDYILTLAGAFPVAIRMVRVSPDETSQRRQNRTFWFSYTEIIDAKLAYPNSALAFLRFDSRQFSSIPVRKYLIRGIKVRVPNNATIDTTTNLGRVIYNGLWTGAFSGTTKWCADPAWCLYDLLSDTRYGAGIAETSLDKFDFYAISQYCNELVPDGFGGLEPRFQCHIVLNSREEIYNTIQEFVSLFRGIAYYGAGSMVLLQDKPSNSQYLLGPNNVVNGEFVYSGSSQKTRHTTATVAYQSYETLGEVEFEYVEDAEAIIKFGIINKEVRAVGCYSRGQAHRLGKWLLLSEQNLTETVSFAVGIDSGIILRPGMVIDIADPVKAGNRRSGRIAAATLSTVTIDDPSLTLNLALSPTISVLLPTGLVETRTIVSRNGAIVITSLPFSQAPNAQAVWLIETNDVKANQFRVISVSEADDGTYSVTALSYNESIYNAIENDVKLDFRKISNLSLFADPPSNLTATEYLYQDGTAVLTAAELSWIAPAQRTTGYVVSYKIDSDNWISVETINPSIRLTGLRNGKLYAQVASVNTLGKPGKPALAEFTLLGKLAPPGDVQNLSIEPISYNSARLRWDATVDLDVKIAGRVRIRHSAKTDGTGTWGNSIDLIPAVAGYSTEAIVPLIEGEILVKFEDDGGRQSVNETSVIVDLPDTMAPLLVVEQREDSNNRPFQGSKNGTFYDSVNDILKLDYTQSFDAIPDTDLLSSVDTTSSEIYRNGTYDFLNILDLEGVFALDLSRYFVTRGDYPNAGIDERTSDVDTWSDWDGTVPDKVNARLLVSYTTGNCSGTYTQSGTTVTVNAPGHGYLASQEITVSYTTGLAISGTFTISTANSNSFTYVAASSLTTSGSVKLTGGGPWSEFQDFVAGTYRGRGFRFRALLETEALDQQILVDELGYAATFQRRTEHSDGIISSGGAVKNIVFAHPFWTGTASIGGFNAYLPSIGITAHNMGSTEDFVVTNVSATGFSVEFRQSGNPINRNFTWSATGYGKGD